MNNEKNNPVLSVVVPVFNEEGNVTRLHQKIVQACDALALSYEIIFVDDGSTDATSAICEKLSPLKFIAFRRNFGQTAAFDAGFKASQGDIIITMDGDLQNDPADIGLLLDEMDKGYDVVAGWRFDRKDSFSKRFFSRTADKLRKILLNDSIHDSGCSLKAFNGEALRNIDLFGEMHRFIPAILELDGYRVGEVKVSHHARTSGVTKYNWKRSVKGFVDMISLWFWRKYASRPVHFFGGGGLLLIFIGGLIMIWMMIEKLFFDASLAERIWPLMSVFLIMLGVQFFIFGLLADIMTKNYYKIHKRMNYAIRSEINNQKNH